MPSDPTSEPAGSAVRPERCHAYAAFQRVEPCPGEACPFFRVPGIDGCALAVWAPNVEADQVSAAWFLGRRLEAEQARAAREERFGLGAGCDTAATESKPGCR